MIGIYKITSPKSRIYIGQSIDIKNRFKSYKSLYTKVIYQHRLYNSFIKYGVDNHIFETIEECEVDKLNERERYYQDLYDVLGKGGLNCRLTKTNDKSGKVSYESKKRMSNAQSGEKHHRYGIKGKDNPLYGRKHTLETRLKISNSLLGKKRSQEFKYSRSGKLNPNYNIKMTDCQKEKLRAKALLRYKDNDHPRSKIVIDLDMGVYYETAKECAKSLIIVYSTLKCKLNRNKNEKRFKYI